MEGWVTIMEAARRYGKHYQSIVNYVRAGRLVTRMEFDPHRNISRWLIAESSLRELAERVGAGKARWEEMHYEKEYHDRRPDQGGGEDRACIVEEAV